MSEQFGLDAVSAYAGLEGSLTETESYTEHQDALDATVFRPNRDACELVLELESGELRVRRSR